MPDPDPRLQNCHLINLFSAYLLGILVVLFFMVTSGPLKEHQVVFIHVAAVLDSRVFPIAAG
jgi:hypothetical protein